MDFSNNAEVEALMCEFCFEVHELGALSIRQMTRKVAFLTPKHG